MQLINCAPVRRGSYQRPRSAVIAAYEWNGSLFAPDSGEALAAGDVRLFFVPAIPFSNRVADAVPRWGGAAYPLQRYLLRIAPIHGNGWRRAGIWSSDARARDSAQQCTTPQETTRKNGRLPTARGKRSTSPRTH
jgi:galactose mutarotase-like enzyme